MLTTSRSLTFGVFVTLSLIFYFQGIPFPYKGSAASKQPLSADKAAPIIGETIVEVAQEHCPRFRQATLFRKSEKIFVYEGSLKTHVDHGKKWRVPTHILRQDQSWNGENGKDILNKIGYIQALVANELAKPVSRRSEWIVWFNVDTIILNQNIPWSIFLPPNGFDHIYVLGTKDHEGFDSRVWFLRVNEWSVHILADAVALSASRPGITLAGSNDDQNALKRVFNESDNRKHVLYEPADWFNSYAKPHGRPFRGTAPVTKGDLLVQCSEYQGNDKSSAIESWLARLDNNETFDALQVPLSEMTLPSRIGDFWTSLKSAKKIMQKAADIKDEGYLDGTDQAVIENVESACGELSTVTQLAAFDTEKMREGIRKLNMALEGVYRGREKIEPVPQDLGEGKDEEPQIAADEQRDAQQRVIQNAEGSRKTEESKSQAQMTEEAQQIADAKKTQESEGQEGEEDWHKNQVAKAKEIAVAANKEEQEED